MVIPTLDTGKIEAILFDMNGTLRQRIPDGGWQRQSVERLLFMLGKPDAPASFLDELTRRYKSYTKWADDHQTSLPEAEIWIRWIAPECPREHIEHQAVELMLALRNRNGRPILKPGAAAVISELHRRGYRLGVISNTTSSADLPRFIEDCGLKTLFEVVILSSELGIRKPGPGIFREATRLMRLDPGQCAYIGNKIAIDIVGAYKAGFGMTMLIRPNNALHASEEDQIKKPDGIFHELVDLLEVFPPRSQK